MNWKSLYILALLFFGPLAGAEQLAQEREEPTRWGVSVSFGQSFGLTSVDAPTAPTNPPPGAPPGRNLISVSKTATPAIVPDDQNLSVLSARAGYAFSPSARAFMNVPYALQQGALDPSAGIGTALELSQRPRESASLWMAIQASAPVSTRSQDEGNLTTITLLAGPSYRHESFLIGVTTQLAYSFYSGSGQSSSDPLSPEVLRSTNTLSFGVRLSRDLGLSTSAGIGYVSRRDGSGGFGLEAAPLSANYSVGALTFAGNLSLLVAPTSRTGFALPNQAMVGATISYTFGNPLALMGGVALRTLRQ